MVTAWKKITIEPDTYCLTVPGGWLYLVHDGPGKNAICFVPKPHGREDSDP
jgi:hypothetical protein